MLTCGPPCSPPRLQVSSFLPHIGLIVGHREGGSLPPANISTPISSGPQGSELPGTSCIRRFCQWRGLSSINPRTCPSHQEAYLPIIGIHIRAYPTEFRRRCEQDHRWPGRHQRPENLRCRFRFASRGCGPQSLPFAAGPRADLLLCWSPQMVVGTIDLLLIVIIIGDILLG